MSAAAAAASASDRVMGVFTDAGHERVEPPILQPAERLIARFGEEMRARAYVFTDPDGVEMALRVDLTGPIAGLAIARGGLDGGEARLCAAGPVFRHPQAGAPRPREFLQCGVERYGGARPGEADAETLALALQAVAACGAAKAETRIGDLALFHALIDDLPLGGKRRARARRLYWRPEAFHAELNAMRGGIGSSRLDEFSSLEARLAELSPEAARELVAGVLAASGAQAFAGRAPEDIAGRLIARAAEAAEPPPPGSALDAIEAYLAIRANGADAIRELDRVADGAGPAFAAARARFAERLAALDAAGVDPARLEFDAEFGRNLEYYTGFVFELRGPGGALYGGGGRYDGLIAALGGAPTPAVGCALRPAEIAGGRAP